ncbi:hypothetical protein J27TS8_02750 [Robertmurraya siralis]|uniref:G5 domain-containing protein n=1 Tax=Robertmurraya siralis TaxID=77777 RepID=A0A919WEE2_9BACI|nr:G5 domain-containing protein [Robertmurraya siralis]GIN60282.1 hypothetical protein J27TS8_02750 [Robertmurraya siralis]
MRNQHGIKLFLVLMISVAYIFSFSHFGTLAYGAIVKNHDFFAEGTKIGSLSVAGKTANEALQLTDEELTKWLNETTITLKYKENNEQLDLRYFTFDLTETVQKAKNGQSNPVSVQFNSLDETLYSLSSRLNKEDIALEELEAEIMRAAQLLEIGSYQIRIEDYLLDGQSNEPQVISEFQLDSAFVENELDLFIGKTIELKATSQFSLLDYVKDEIGTVSALTLSKISTSIYEVILPTNFEMIERHISSELPEYAALGFEAKVDPELNYDLIFANGNEWSYFIEFEKVDDVFITYLKGPTLLNRYILLQEDEESFKPKTILQFNSELSPTESRVKVAGKDGQFIKIYREHRDENGAVLKKELISEDFYPPIHQIEITGLIVSTGDSTVTPGTENAEADGDPESQTGESTSIDENGEQAPPSDRDHLDSPKNDENSLWGKENEIPK